jgi:hypothetical protein
VVGVGVKEGSRSSLPQGCRILARSFSTLIPQLNSTADNADNTDTDFYGKQFGPDSFTGQVKGQEVQSPDQTGLWY